MYGQYRHRLRNHTAFKNNFLLRRIANTNMSNEKENDKWVSNGPDLILIIPKVLVVWK